MTKTSQATIRAWPMVITVADDRFEHYRHHPDGIQTMAPSAPVSNRPADRSARTIC
jgi:hypothetical protein